MTTSENTGAPAARYRYGPDPEQFGELRLPPGSGPHPAIVYIHGGGWQSSITLAGAVTICTALTARGYATWSLEYRRVGNGGGWPATFDDVPAAAAHLKVLAPDASIDLDRVFVAGQSAGGQLALWLASRLTPGRDEAARAQIPRFIGVVAYAPATNLRAIAAGDQDGALPTLLGGSPDQVPDRFAAVSPIELAPIGLPQLVVHGRRTPSCRMLTARRTSWRPALRVIGLSWSPFRERSTPSCGMLARPPSLRWWKER